MFNKIIIYKNNLIQNIKQVKLQNPKSKICAMVKANAYGVGLKEVVSILEPYVDFWGVTCFFEASLVRNLTHNKILIVGPIEKGCVSSKFSYTCGSVEDVEYLAGLKKEIHIHIKINSGMNRYGFTNIKDIKRVLKIINKSSLKLEGMYTHFATTDSFVEKQMEMFSKIAHHKALKNHKFLLHADNSGVNETKNHNLDMVRIGFNLYNKKDDWFSPVVEIKTQVVEIRSVKKGELVGYDYRYVATSNKKIGIIPIGYADGMDLKYIGFKLNINGKSCEILNICMDCCMIDVTNVKIKKGDELFVLNKFNTLADYAKYSKTSEYEIMCKFSNMRAERIII